ncbi:MAG TPA: response regulator transcription factor [Bacteroidia bacterium]|nr:response regulator transcription factor [Bacteroidia bacterium]HNU34658.1 response regulator transcription factor [Bacteroidia bacterium]
MAVRVTIFDDNKKLLDSLSVLLDGSPGFQVAGIFTDCTDLESKVEKSQPDVVLMDIEMPGINGIEGVKILRQKFPRINVMMQTAFENDENVFEAICAGASGYILKNTPPAKILECIIEVYQGGSPMSPSVARKVLGFLQQPKPEDKKTESTNVYNLSVREKEVLSYLVKGMSYKMIADQCSITYETVRSHMKSIYEKLHVASMTEAVAKAIHNKIVM